MAKQSKIAKNERRKAVVERYAARRAELKEIIRRPSSTRAAREAAVSELRRQPRDASATRVRHLPRSIRPTHLYLLDSSNIYSDRMPPPNHPP
ncbi:hypothetical protein ABT031_37135, partial [Streptomyces sp. NPDC096934]